MNRLPRLLAPLLWLTLIAVYFLAIMPPEGTPRLASDKVEHMAAFLTLTILAALAFPKVSPVLIGAGLATFGAFIEFSQMVPMIHRDPSGLDWLADVCAIMFGLLVITPFRVRAEDAR
jgi:nitrate/nitrite transporter NarK